MQCRVLTLLSTRFGSIVAARSVGLFPWAGAGGGGPLLRDPRAFSRGSGEQNRRTDLEVGGVMGPHGTVHTDFTVVASSGGPMRADPAQVLQAARSGAHEPRSLCRREWCDTRKIRKYAGLCRAAGYSFIHFALSAAVARAWRAFA